MEIQLDWHEVKMTEDKNKNITLLYDLEEGIVDPIIGVVKTDNRLFGWAPGNILGGIPLSWNVSPEGGWIPPMTWGFEVDDGGNLIETISLDVDCKRSISGWIIRRDEDGYKFYPSPFPGVLVEDPEGEFLIDGHQFSESLDNLPKTGNEVPWDGRFGSTFYQVHRGDVVMSPSPTIIRLVMYK